MWPWASHFSESVLSGISKPQSSGLPPFHLWVEEYVRSVFPQKRLWNRDLLARVLWKNALQNTCREMEKQGWAEGETGLQWISTESSADGCHRALELGQLSKAVPNEDTGARPLNFHTEQPCHLNAVRLLMAIHREECELPGFPTGGNECLVLKERCPIYTVFQQSHRCWLSWEWEHRWPVCINMVKG